MNALRFRKGGEARFVAVQGESVVLASTIPSPPGSRLEGVLTAGSEAEAVVRIKVHGSKREADGTFTLRGRLIDATRALRERLAALVSPGSSVGGEDG